MKEQGSDLERTFARLKKILQKHAKHLTVTADKPDAYYLDAAYSENSSGRCSLARRRSRNATSVSI